MPTHLPFAPAPSAKASLRPGTLYAVDGGDSYIYYGQVAPDKTVGFFQYRDRQLAVGDALSSALMCRIVVGHSSIGSALRSGAWLKLGAFSIHSELIEESVFVQWPVGTLDVTVWKGGSATEATQVHDPRIQRLELMAAYDAAHHVPDRLRADYGCCGTNQPSAGSIWQARRMKEDAARSMQPWTKLLPGWVPVESET